MLISETLSAADSSAPIARRPQGNVRNHFGWLFIFWGE
ncbi:hypothetical protein THTE_2570 [Thermogutta terrifontis]|uniref:Uncharacterized protein n=1 Tax=Thermogutta terrifontis TaxID=1331910 RepID=A0A286RGV7_9BACT|nr:hypothetical protein THTE_2570 [Thermogutta terrifontis]